MDHGHIHVHEARIHVHEARIHVHEARIHVHEARKKTPGDEARCMHAGFAMHSYVL